MESLWVTRHVSRASGTGSEGDVSSPDNLLRESIEVRRELRLVGWKPPEDRVQTSLLEHTVDGQMLNRSAAYVPIESLQKTLQVKKRK